MKFLNRADLFYKSISNEIPIDANVSNFVFSDRTRVYGGTSGDEIYGTVSYEYPISIVPEFAIDTSSVTDWSKDSILTSIIDETSTRPPIWFSSIDNVLLARIESYSAVAGRYHGSGLNDATFGATFNYTSFHDTYDVVAKISSTGAPDQVQFSIDGGVTYSGATNITGSSQSVTGTGTDVSVTFGATTGHTLNDRWHFLVDVKTVEVMSFPTTIQDFYVFNADPTLIAVKDQEHLYMLPLTFDGRDGPDDLETLYNSFNISRYTRVSLKDVPITNYKVINDGGTLKVLFETKNVHQGYSFNRNVHFKITPTESNMDLNPLRHGGTSGYIYLDNSLETNTPTELNVKWDSRYRTSAEGKKYIWAKLTDERGVPVTSTTLATQLYTDRVASGTLAADTFAAASAEVTINDETPTTNAYGIIEIEITYVKTAALSIWMELDISYNNLVQRIILSRDYTAAQVS